MSTTPFAPYGPLITAMVTPFDASLQVDYARAEELAVRLLENGSSGLVVSGTTGESPTLTPEEKLELFRRIKKVAGNAPIIANTGDNETAFSVEFTRRAQDTGVDAFLLVVPYYNKPSQEGLYRHFEAIANAVELPCLLYNVPGRTGRNMSASTVARLSKIENIVGTKEASGDMSLTGHIRANTPEDWAIYSGDDAATFPMLPIGCCGCISVVSHIAGNDYRQMLDSYWAGDVLTARSIYLRLLPVIEALFPATAGSPSPVKAALSMQGFDTGGLRLPLVECEPGEIAALKQAMEKAGLL